MSYERAHGDAGLGGISGVVSSLPVGYTLGEERLFEGIWYRLMYNAGNSQANPGLVVAPLGVGGPFSGTITTTSDGGQGYGAVVVKHATATTGTYFWGAFKGYPVKVQGGTASIATGGDFMIAVDGAVSTHTTAATATVIGQRETRVLVGRNMGQTSAATITTLTASGDCYIDFPTIVGAVR